MPLTAAQTAAKTFLTTSTENYTSPIDGSVNTVSGWYTLGADNVVIPLMNDVAFGTSLGRTAAVSSLSGDEIIAAVAETADWVAMTASPGTMAGFNAIVQRVPVPKALFAALDNTLSTYALAAAAFNALKAVDSSVWQGYAADNSAQFTQADLDAIRAS